MSQLLKKFLRSIPTGRLLSVLFSGNRYSYLAWEEFLQRFSKLILKVIWKYESDYDKVMEAYLFICEKLTNNDFEVLKKYNDDFDHASPKFSTWLMAVSKNICVDLYRKSNGRKRYPKGIRRLSKEDRLFFELYYWKGLPVDEIAKTMGLTNGTHGNAISDSLNRINDALVRTPKTPKTVQMVAFNESRYIVSDELEEPDLNAQMETWIETLPANEKLILRLRFWENLSAREIAEILDIEPYVKVYTMIKSSLKKLREKKEGDGIS